MNQLTTIASLPAGAGCDQGLCGETAPMTRCGCIGPQRGEPVCPCQMRAVTIENGRYVMRRDLGPVPPAAEAERRERAASRMSALLFGYAEPTPADLQGFEPFEYVERS